MPTTSLSLPSMGRFIVSCFLLLLHSTAAAKVKVFLLLGQSNMEGMGRTEHLELITSFSKKYNWLLDRNSGEYLTRSDVRVVESLPDGKFANGAEDLTLRGKAMFGPEIGFGLYTAAFERESPILLIKCAQGGTHLGVEWRSPSAAYADYRDPNHPSMFIGRFGTMWNQMRRTVTRITSNISQYMPGYNDYEIAGILWFQGWNDAFNDGMRKDYPFNLQSLVIDLHEEYGYDVPILIGELGQEGSNRNQQGPVEAIRRAQEQVVANTWLLGPNMAFVPTSPYVDASEPTFDAIHHYYGKADTFLEIGLAFGRALHMMPSRSSSISSNTNTKSLLLAAPPQEGECLAIGATCVDASECCSNRCNTKQCEDQGATKKKLRGEKTGAASGGGK